MYMLSLPVSSRHSGKRLITFVAAILISGVPLVAQVNLVTHPGFEQYKKCPENPNNQLVTGFELLPRWFTVSDASPDYFNSCSKSERVNVPKNFAGNMKARSGNGYIGLILKSDPRYYRGSANYTEHIQNRLASPLKKDKYYCFEIWMCLGKNSTIAAKDFGVYFSKEKITFPNPPDTLPRAHIQFEGDEFLTSTGRWVPLRGVYKARGGERFLTIGNFIPWHEKRFLRLRTTFTQADLREFAYYIFDDVSLVEMKDPSKCDCNMATLEEIPVVKVVKEDPVPDEPINEFEQVNVGESFVLQNIFFAFDKSDLLPASYPELDKLVALMKKYTAMTIEIGGHTDGMGSVEYNLKLSADRANSVVKYLISQGIEPKRLTWKGYGKSHPIADNTTDEGRQTNRRVEFKVMTK
jgi:OmpA-OmpF porin, OOP family